ncbi:hypothetical protein DSM104299_05294 [Baekduia alba]|uniref:hypothetical protein n=1 Tax=Baekduia alba TaxID=2997333 RepID=UPI00234170C6|nr:hypothetical protein [Baekduia alba]WCB96534.1 hypothetical protein DSM104299_05294 [Baekduia alba]
MIATRTMAVLESSEDGPGWPGTPPAGAAVEAGVASVGGVAVCGTAVDWIVAVEGGVVVDGAVVDAGAVVEPGRTDEPGAAEVVPLLVVLLGLADVASWACARGVGTATASAAHASPTVAKRQRIGGTG